MPYEEPHYPQSHHLAKADLLSENAGPPLYVAFQRIAVISNVKGNGRY